MVRHEENASLARQSLPVQHTDARERHGQHESHEGQHRAIDTLRDQHCQSVMPRAPMAGRPAETSPRPRAPILTDLDSTMRHGDFRPDSAKAHEPEPESLRGTDRA
jgi:hypothetical protein